VKEFFPNRKLDTGIIKTVWLSQKEIEDSIDKLRSPLVLSCVNDYLEGNLFPLSVIRP
jgi:aminopeptidase-like protein